MSATLELNAQNFNETIEGNGIVLVDWWAEWCGPCKMFAPNYEKASEKYDDVVFGKVDTEAEQQLAAQFGISSIPTLMVFRDRVLVYSQAGALPPAQLEQLIQGARDLDMDEVHQQIAERENATSETAAHVG